MFLKAAWTVLCVFLAGVTVQSSALLTSHIKEKEYGKTVHYRVSKILARGASAAATASKVGTQVAAVVASPLLGAAIGGAAGTGIGIKLSELVVIHSSMHRMTGAIAIANCIVECCTGSCSCCCALVVVLLLVAALAYRWHLIV